MTRKIRSSRSPLAIAVLALLPFVSACDQGGGGNPVTPSPVPTPSGPPTGNFILEVWEGVDNRCYGPGCTVKPGYRTERFVLPAGETVHISWTAEVGVDYRFKAYGENFAPFGTTGVAAFRNELGGGGDMDWFNIRQDSSHPASWSATPYASETNPRFTFEGRLTAPDGEISEAVLEADVDIIGGASPVQ